MTQDKRSTYILSTLIGGLSLLLLFLPIEHSIWQPICLFLPAAVATGYFIKKKNILSINKYQVLLIVTVSALLRIMIHYLLGYYFGMARRTVEYTWQELAVSVMGTATVIASTEVIRAVFTAQRYKWASMMAFVIGTASDILLVSNLTGLESMNRFMDIMGLTLMPAIIGNAVYQYLAKRYGILPVLTVRSLIALYPTVIPYVTFTPDAVVAFGNLIFPIFIYFFISFLYEHKKVTHRISRKLSGVWIAISVFITVLIVMIVSCQFAFGALVIGTESMTGELNVGDVAVYERYEDQVIEVGDIIVFQSGSSRIIHRVVDIKSADNTLRYITQGDANEDPDMGYRTSNDIVGMVKFKVSYVGYPTIWLNKMFSNAK